MTLLSVQDLAVEFTTRRGSVPAVQGIDLSVARGQTIGVVGESGSGKSVSAYAVLQILDPSAKISRGIIQFDGNNLLELPEKQLQDIRGRDVAMIFQNPRASLNPIRTVGRQLEDVLRRHNRAAGNAWRMLPFSCSTRYRSATPSVAITPTRLSCPAGNVSAS